MRCGTIQKPKTITEEELKEKLMQHYGRGVDREMVKTEIKNSHGTVGSVLYSLDGSPPKGYALFVPQIRRLSLYDAHGKRFRIISEVYEIE